jgi:heterodisulfide reductase subunit B
VTTVSYYPGCSLEASAKEFDESIRAVSNALGIRLKEIEDWSCCGATAAHALDERLSVELPTRNLAQAEHAGHDVIVPCASCFNRLKTAEKVLLSGDVKSGYTGKIRVRDLLDFMSDTAILNRIKEMLQKPLKGLKTVCYYGCLVSRPPKITDTPDPENPQNMERVMQVLGASPYPWSYKTDCCGGSMALARPDIIKTLVQRLYERANETGTECFVVSCQMCQANLDMRQKEISIQFGKQYDLPVLYFTELIGLALGLPDVRKWFRRHFVDPVPLLRRKGLL